MMQLTLEFPTDAPVDMVTVTMGVTVAQIDAEGQLTGGFLAQYRRPVSPFCGLTEGNGHYWSEPPHTDRRVWHCGIHGFEDRPL